MKICNLLLLKPRLTTLNWVALRYEALSDLPDRNFLTALKFEGAKRHCQIVRKDEIFNPSWDVNDGAKLLRKIESPSVRPYRDKMCSRQNHSSDIPYGFSAGNRGEIPFKVLVFDEPELQTIFDENYIF